MSSVITPIRLSLALRRSVVISSVSLPDRPEDNVLTTTLRLEKYELAGTAIKSTMTPAKADQPKILQHQLGASSQDKRVYSLVEE